MFSNYIMAWKKCFDFKSKATAQNFIYFYIVAYALVSLFISVVHNILSIFLHFGKIGHTPFIYAVSLMSLIDLVHFPPRFSLQCRRLNMKQQSHWRLVWYYLIIIFGAAALLFRGVPAGFVILIFLSATLFIELIWLGREDKKPAQ